MIIWITYFVDDYSSEWFVDKVFDTEKKAKEHIKFKDKMTGNDWGYFDKEVE